MIRTLGSGFLDQLEHNLALGTQTANTRDAVRALAKDGQPAASYLALSSDGVLKNRLRSDTRGNFCRKVGASLDYVRLHDEEIFARFCRFISEIGEDGRDGNGVSWTSTNHLYRIHLSFDDSAPAKAVAELIIHEFCHVVLFCDDACSAHKLHSLDYKVSGALTGRLISVEAAFHSYMIAAEIVAWRKLTGTTSEKTFHPETHRIKRLAATTRGQLNELLGSESETTTMLTLAATQLD